ncbi:hypothetical protein [Vampirovibrio chlorellavorus]|uniref:hypothetical protein n=1 Tax=Vampirovibrio chlorellavorus TaxID=758823 RepID=UPI0026F150A4|nr:hypothetical protein [Vampirovibrio chlorellavorus]
MTPWFAPACWAENFNLDSVDLSTTHQQTNIILHTGSIVPVQKVLTSEKKLILEVDQVNATETIRTNFGGASNISHVILQPINEHKIRLIVRGENLAPPSVAFTTPNSASAPSGPGWNNPDSFDQQTRAALKQIQDSGIQPANYRPAGKADMPAPTSARPVDMATSKPVAASNTDTQNLEESIPFGGLVESKPAKPLMSPSSDEPKAPLSPTQAKSEQAKPLNLPSQDMPGTPDPILENAKNGQYNNYILGGILALMALGVGGFVVHKILKLKQVEPDLEELILEQHNGKKVSFREMADAYRSKHDPARKTEHPEAPVKNSGKKHADDVIGLRSLSQIEKTPILKTPAEKPQAAPKTGSSRATQPTSPAKEPFGGQTPNMEQLLAMVQAVSEPRQKPMKTPAAPRQAVSQYKQANQPAPKAPPKGSFPDETMVKEMRRAQALQQELLQQAQQQIAAAQGNTVKPKNTPVNRAAAAQKAVNPVNFKNAPATNPLNASKVAQPAKKAAGNAQNGPLPGNPEVLNFLRNVADLMEKDGKPQIANSIHKNLNPNSVR